MGIYFDLLDGDEAEVDRAGIASETDVETLWAYYDALSSIAEELGAMAAANREGGIENHQLCTKYGNIKIAFGWVKRRLSDLGEEVHVTNKEANQAAEIRNLQRQNQLLRDELATYKLVETA